jgi:hypothetical protein
MDARDGSEKYVEKSKERQEERILVKKGGLRKEERKIEEKTKGKRSEICCELAKDRRNDEEKKQESIYANKVVRSKKRNTRMQEECRAKE